MGDEASVEVTHIRGGFRGGRRVGGSGEGLVSVRGEGSGRIPWFMCGKTSVEDDNV